MVKTTAIRSVLAGVALLANGCSNATTMDVPAGAATELLSVSPMGGATSVAAMPDLVFTFNHPMASGMQQYLALHHGDLTGATTSMTCGWGDSLRTLTCRPNEPLAPGSDYTVHMGGGMMDADDHPVDMGRYGMTMGGSWATGTMMGSQLGMMGGQQSMMGNGWRDAQGTYGMAFRFTTR